LTEDELNQHLDAAEKNPEQVARATTGLSPKVMRYKPAPDKWSIQEILGHLADSEIVYAYRIRQALADKNPTFAPIDQDDWARHLGYMEASAPELIALYALVRRSNLRLLRRITPPDLEKGGFHPERKRKVTVAELVEMMAKHGPNHLAQIERLKQQAA
jgi:uncharacterized damage-inducible protein DinB